MMNLTANRSQCVTKDGSSTLTWIFLRRIIILVLPASEFARW